MFLADTVLEELALLIDEALELTLLETADDSAALVAELADDFFGWTFSVFGAVVFFGDLLALKFPHAASETDINTAADPRRVVLTDFFINNISSFSIFIEKRYAVCFQKSMPIFLNSKFYINIFRLNVAFKKMFKFFILIIF